ncbi:hypothetical protein ACFYY8_00065 [Streptosporangium sp. NPDC001559]|uniref:hypothetical protein n=1 Tax=Streptosporangium sp. NPDC001559 TaxID=3366187 RepID=UPI0036E28667
MWRTLPLLVLTEVASSPHGVFAPGGTTTATLVRPCGRWSGPRGGHTPKDVTIAVPAHRQTRRENTPPTGHGRHLGSIIALTSVSTSVSRNDAATRNTPGDPRVSARAEHTVGRTPRVGVQPVITGEHQKTGHATGTANQETTSDGASSFGVPGDGLR